MVQPMGKKLFFQRDGNYWALSIENGTEVPVTDFEGQWGRLGQDLATDGQYLYFYLARRLSATFGSRTSSRE